MPRAHTLSDFADQARDPNAGEWQALRGELVALLDKVESHYGQVEDEQPEPPASALAQRVRNLRNQVTGSETNTRHREALRTVKRAVDRFTDRDMAMAEPDMPDELTAAIAEIRGRQGIAPAPAPVRRASEMPELRELGTLVGGMSQRLERLEGELKTQRSSSSHVREVAEKLRKLLAEPMVCEGNRLQVTPSIGIALIPDHGDTPADLLKRADIALYRAKDAGRNAIQLFQSTMQEVASTRLQLESELRLALLNEEFELFLQPQVDARSDTIIGAEALLRWQHPQHGLRSPAHFIDVLEDSGLIIEVGDWVIGEVCRMTASLLASGLVQADSFSLCINISPRQFRQNDFVERILAALEESALPVRMIKLEITEGIVIENLDDTIAKMHHLRTHGVSFAMDDFGTGYSSLTYLKRLPVDLLKIDQSFVRDALEDGNDAEIIRAIVSMAKSLGLEVIAEGVEQKGQLDLLQLQDCHLTKAIYSATHYHSRNSASCCACSQRLRNERASCDALSTV